MEERTKRYRERHLENHVGCPNFAKTGRLLGLSLVIGNDAVEGRKALDAAVGPDCVLP